MLGMYLTNFVFFVRFTAFGADENIFASIAFIPSMSFLILEARKIFYFRLRYFLSPYNWISLATFSLTFLLAFLQTLDCVLHTFTAPSLPQELPSIAIFFLWTHMVHS